MNPDLRAEALYAAFLWWTAVLAARVLLGGLSLAALTGLVHAGQAAPFAVTLLGVEGALSVLVLWAGAGAVLRPGGLTLSPFWVQPGAAALAALAFLGATGLSLGLPMFRTVILSRLMPIEEVARLALWSSGIGLAHTVVHALTLATVAVALALRATRDPPLGVS